MEGNVYLCSWLKSRRKYTIFLVGNEDIKAAGNTFDEAEEKILENICLNFGDGEAIVEYVKPLPKTEFEKKHGIPGIVSVSGNDGFGTLLNAEDRPDQPICPLCERKRFSPMPVAPKYDMLCSSDGAVMGDLNPVFSDSFFSLFTKKELSEFKLRKIIGAKRPKKEFFEILGVPKIFYVGFRKFPGLLNKKCKKCGIGCCTYLNENKLYKFIALEDLLKPIPKIFIVGDDDGSIDLCLTSEKYNELIGRRGMKNICSSRIWIVKGHEIVRNNDEVYPEHLYWKMGKYALIDS